MEHTKARWGAQTDAKALTAAIEDFERVLRGWWWSCGICSASAHASCAPDAAGSDRWLLKERIFDNGFHADLPGQTLADALRDVTIQALKARAVFFSNAGVAPPARAREASMSESHAVVRWMVFESGLPVYFVKGRLNMPPLYISGSPAPAARTRTNFDGPHVAR